MTKDTFLNAWSRELSIESALSTWDAKRFLYEFYSAVVGLHKNMEITEEEIKQAASDYEKIACCEKDHPWLKEYVNEDFVAGANWALSDRTEYGEYDGQRFPIGTRLTSKENGELIIAPEGTPEEEIVHTVKKD